VARFEDNAQAKTEADGMIAPARSAGAAAFVGSELFSRTFLEGMALVEETAAYLDGDGKADSRDLHRGAALAYAGESMRLTTRLMQIASWLLVLRAVRESEMSLEEAAQSKYRLPSQEDTPSGLSRDVLPVRLVTLADRGEQLFRRVARLDQELFIEDGRAPASERDAQAQQRALFAAFNQS